MKLGIIDIDKLYLGDTEVEKAYLGTNQVYSAESPTHDYSNDYLTIVSLVDNNTIYWYQGPSNSSGMRKTISVSTDNGKTWISKQSNNSDNGTILTTLNRGNKLLIKGTNTYYSNPDSNYYNSIIATGNFDVEGNIMSLIYGDNFIGQTTIPSYNTSRYSSIGGLFINSTNLINAINLILPATTLYEACYRDMFKNCSNLITAPELPAVTTVRYCYYRMFMNCSKLSYIKCLAGNIAVNSTGEWLYGASNNGTFIKNPSFNWPTGTHGIPSGWTIVNAS